MARINKITARKTLEELTSLVKSGEILNFTECELEKKLNVTRKTLRGYLKDIKQEIGGRNIKIITIDFIETMEIMMNDIKRLWMEARESGDSREILFYTKQMFEAWDRFAGLLERFGIKPKVADRVDITSVNLNIDIKAVSNEILNEIRGH